MRKGKPKWTQAVKREKPLYKRDQERRDDFARDFNRILHCTAYRRLKHKTQVFFSPQNDHICTRIEHVNHVAAVSYTICKFLGLNTGLSNAIAIGHDLGHSPFGHYGEKVLRAIAERDLKESFWHEKNSLHLVDNVETLPNPDGKEETLNLTYAVRDGLVLHCGEVDDAVLRPRNKAIRLEKIKKVGEYAPFTWEACVVKIADKISYLGRDIEDAIALKILTYAELKELKAMIKKMHNVRIKEVNNTVLMHDFITDLCNNSSPRTGIQCSKQYYKFVKNLKDFSLRHIYNHQRLSTYKEYANLMISSLYKTLCGFYAGKETLKEIYLFRRKKGFYPLLLDSFAEWLLKHSSLRHYISSGECVIGSKREITKGHFRGVQKKLSYYENEVICDIEKLKSYKKTVIDFIAGMTDNFAIRVFNELISF
jgi:dGTPase